MPASGAPLIQAAVANFNPFGRETTVSTQNPDRGPVLIIAGAKDNTAPTAITTQKYLASTARPSPRSSTYPTVNIP